MRKIVEGKRKYMKEVVELRISSLFLYLILAYDINHIISVRDCSHVLRALRRLEINQSKERAKDLLVGSVRSSKTPVSVFLLIR